MACKKLSAYQQQDKLEHSSESTDHMQFAQSCNRSVHEPRYDFDGQNCLLIKHSITDCPTNLNKNC